MQNKIVFIFEVKNPLSLGLPLKKKKRNFKLNTTLKTITYGKYL